VRCRQADLRCCAPAGCANGSWTWPFPVTDCNGRPCPARAMAVVQTTALPGGRLRQSRVRSGTGRSRARKRLEPGPQAPGWPGRPRCGGGVPARPRLQHGGSGCSEERRPADRRKQRGNRDGQVTFAGPSAFQDRLARHRHRPRRDHGRRDGDSRAGLTAPQRGSGRPPGGAIAGPSWLLALLPLHGHHRPGRQSRRALQSPAAGVGRRARSTLLPLTSLTSNGPSGMPPAM